MIAPLLVLLLAAPAFRAEGGIPAEAEALAAAAWKEEAALLAAEGVPPPAAPKPIRIMPAAALPAGESGRSRLGVIFLSVGNSPHGLSARAPAIPPLAPHLAATLRHEVAHQLLLEACPAASGDRLFHEAFAVSASGELVSWAAGEEGGAYLPLSHALEVLSRAAAGEGARGLDGAGARRALARLLSESPAPRGRLPAVLSRPLSRCEAGATWIPLRPQDLAGEAPAADAMVIVSRHSGEVLVAEGAASVPLPFGSTLKPFLLAGAPRPPPLLRPDLSRPGWRCGDGIPERMDAASALLRSCNGWFLDWSARDPEVIGMGRWGSALRSLGLTGTPASAAEAIGVKPSLRIPPLGLAHAYRLLAEARPDLLDVLSRNAREGTLSGLPASGALEGVALKTGTVLDAGARPRLGLVVAVTPDVVLVMARAGRTPRTFAGDVAAALARIRGPGHEAARVQVLGLLPSEQVEGRCAGKGFAAAAAGPEPAPQGFAPVEALARRGPLLCAGGPWMLRYPGLREARPYAGVITREPPPEVFHPGRSARERPGPDSGSLTGSGDVRSPAGPEPTPRQARARRGSDLVFRTTRLLYAAGVVEAEDARLRGEARIALARVADRNGGAGGSRHPGRPPCDTTHCQVFFGTVTPRREERAALEQPLPPGPWLPFSQGGTAPWTEERTAVEVARALGPGASDLAFGSGRVSFLVQSGERDAAFLERRSVPCELLRGPLRLPSCPSRAERRGDRVRFEGRGAGHGEGLDVEWAARSGLSADEILERAYGAAAR